MRILYIIHSVQSVEEERMHKSLIVWFAKEVITMFLLDLALRVKHLLSFIMSSDILLELIDYSPVIVKQLIVPCLKLIM